MELLEELKSADFRLSIDGEDLLIQGHLSDELRERIREDKYGLMHLIAAGEHRWTETEGWKFELVDLPRLDGNGCDRWMAGRKLDSPERFQFWFVGTQSDSLA